MTPIGRTRCEGVRQPRQIEARHPPPLQLCLGRRRRGAVWRFRTSAHRIVGISAGAPMDLFRRVAAQRKDKSDDRTVHLEHAERTQAPDHARGDGAAVHREAFQPRQERAVRSGLPSKSRRTTFGPVVDLLDRGPSSRARDTARRAIISEDGEALAGSEVLDVVGAHLLAPALTGLLRRSFRLSNSVQSAWGSVSLRSRSWTTTRFRLLKGLARSSSCRNRTGRWACFADKAR